MKNILLFSLMIISFDYFSQKEEFSYIKEYYQPVYLAEKAFFEKDYQKVYDIMSGLEKKCELLNQQRVFELEKYAISVAYLKKNKKAIQLAELLIFHGFELDWLKKEEAYKEIIKTNKWKRLEKKFPKLKKKHLKTINLEVRKEIIEMEFLDQKYRLLMGDGMNNDSLWKIQKTVDSINDTKLKNIINKYGYPNYKIIGTYLIDSLHLHPSTILFHITDNEYYHKTLLKQIDIGNAPPSTLGNYTDSYQRRVKDKKKWIYAVYEGVEPESIIDYENLDKRRVSIGLAPMKLKNEIDDLKYIYWNE